MGSIFFPLKFEVKLLIDAVKCVADAVADDTFNVPSFDRMCLFENLVFYAISY